MLDKEIDEWNKKKENDKTRCEAICYAPNRKKNILYCPETADGIAWGKKDEKEDDFVEFNFKNQF